MSDAHRLPRCTTFLIEFYPAPGESKNAGLQITVSAEDPEDPQTLQCWMSTDHAYRISDDLKKKADKALERYL